MGNDVEEIKSRLNIVDVLGEYIRLEKAGANWKAACPFHNEKTPSFMVSEEKQFWHCFGCQKSGDIFTFVMEMEGLEFGDALKQLAEKAGVKLKSYNPKKTEEKNRTLEILELAAKFYEIQLWKGEGQTKILKYLRERGLQDETIKEFRLGYAPKGWRNMLSFLTARGYKLNEITKTGLLVEKKDAKPMRINEPNANLRTDLENNNFVDSNKFVGSHRFYDRFRDRIIFPVADYSGHIVGYSARVAPGGDESQAKYVNTPETEVYHKSKILFGLDKAKSEIKKQDFALLVEGNMDVIAAAQAGIKNTIAVSGTALTEDQIGIVKRYTKNIRMFFDMDQAGQAATKKSVKLCLGKDISMRVVSLPKGKDAADLARENPKELLKSVDEALEFMEYFFQNIFRKFDKNKIEDKKKITEDMLDIIGSLENAVEKNHWVKKLSQELDAPETALTDMLKKNSLKSRMEKNGRSEKEIGPTTAATKRETLEKELSGLMLVSEIVWKKAEERKGDIPRLSKDSLLNMMLENGEKLAFQFDSLIKFLKDPSQKQLAESIFSEKKYRFDLNGNPEEIILEDPEKEFETCLKELKKEDKKEELKRIAVHLKMAKERRDKKTEEFLIREFDKVSKKLSELLV